MCDNLELSGVVISDREDGSRGAIETILENGARHVDVEIQVTRLRYLIMKN